MADRTTGSVALSRGELFAGLCVLGFANGAIGRIQNVVLQDGVGMALACTFNISVIVWVAFAACPTMLLRARREPLLRADLIMSAGVLAAVMIPIAPLSWVALTGLALYLLLDPFTPHARRSPSPLHRGAWILLATTGAMFWGRVLLFSASGPVLDADAFLVGWLAGAETMGNTVSFAGHAGYVWITPYCSSLTNVSLAILCWVLYSQFRGLRWSLGNAGWCLLACLSVIAINVTRIGLMVLYPERFDFIHSFGADLASWLSVAAVLGICIRGTRHARPAPA